MKKIILITNCFLFTCFTAGVNSNVEADANFEKTIEDYFNVFSETRTEPTQSGWSYWYVREPTTETGMNLQMTYVDQQIETHPPHQHSEKEILYIVEGRAEVFMAGATRVIGPNTSMYCPPDVMHGIKRVDDKPLKYLVIKEGSASASSRKPNVNLPEYTLDNCITVFSEAKADIARTGYFFWFAPKSLTGGINLKMTYVDKLTGTHEPHQHPGEEILLMLEGQAEIHLYGETKIVEPYTSIYYPSYSLHCIKRVNDQPIKYLVINP